MKNKNPFRRLIAAAALVLTLVIVLTALAEGTLSTLYNAGTQLLFDTANATIRAHADFSYNGLHFKTFDGEYRQAGVDSFMDVTLQTPKVDGSVFTGGYTVVGNGGMAYSFEKSGVGSLSYQVNSCGTSESILSSSILRNSILRLGGALIATSENAFAKGITQSPAEDGGVQYHIAIEPGDTPELLNAAGTLMAQLLARKYYYVNYDRAPGSDPNANDLLLYYEDFGALEENVYQQLFGTPMPDDFYERLWGTDQRVADALYAQYSQINDYISEIAGQAYASYTTGLVLILSDGSVEYSEDPGAYFIKSGYRYLDFVDAASTFRTYYEQLTGTPLSANELRAIQSSNNEALLKAYNEIYDRMYDGYYEMLLADQEHPAMLVQPDGTGVPVSYATYCEWDRSRQQSVTSRMLAQMHALELDSASVDAVLDAQGRITSVRGEVCLQVLNGSSTRAPLEVRFDLAVSDYGTSAVEAFDPAQYDLMSQAELMQYVDAGGYVADLINVNDLDEPIPETVVLDGVKYQVML